MDKTGPKKTGPSNFRARSIVFHVFKGLMAAAREKICIERRLRKMCEANAYLIMIIDGKDQLLMESVDILRPEEGSIYL